MPKLNIETCQAYAKFRGGWCLTKVYVNINTPMWWKCGTCFHKWKVAFHGLRHGNQWCPSCADNIRFTIEEVREMGLKRGYILISKKYTSTADELEWLCPEKHKYMSTLANLKDHRGRGCAKCAGLAPIDIKILQQLAIDRGGRLISTEIKNNRDKLEWECKELHRWFAHANNVKDGGTWCYECNGNIPLTRDEFVKLAEKNNGKLITEEFKGINDKVEWECKDLHRWMATPFSIKYTKTWCPDCASFKSERKMREILEELTGAKWSKCRPSWLGGLELDGFWAEQKIAMEYQGIQHYEYNTHFHKSEQDFKDQQERDKRKKEILASKNIILLEIPYKYSYRTPHDNLVDHLQLMLCTVYMERKQLFNTGIYKIQKYKDEKVVYKDLINEKLYSISLPGLIQKIKAC